MSNIGDLNFWGHNVLRSMQDGTRGKHYKKHLSRCAAAPKRWNSIISRKICTQGDTNEESGCVTATFTCRLLVSSIDQVFFLYIHIYIFLSRFKMSGKKVKGSPEKAGVFFWSESVLVYMVHVVKTLWGLRLTLTNNPTLSSLPPPPLLAPFQMGLLMVPPRWFLPVIKPEDASKAPPTPQQRYKSHGTSFPSDLVIY